MQEREPTIRSRELGEGLRRAMEKAGLNGKQAAHLLDWSPSWVSRLLSGKRGCTELDGIVWHKSSYSANGDACVEVAPVSVGVLVRDSKNPAGPTLAFGTPHWRAFLTTVTH